MAGLREIRTGLWHLRQGRARAVQVLAVPPADRTGLRRAAQRPGRRSGLDRPRTQAAALAHAGDPAAAAAIPAGCACSSHPGRFFRAGLRLRMVHPPGPSAHLAQRPGGRRRRSVVRRVGVGRKRRTVARQAGRPERPQRRVPGTRPVVPGAGDPHGLLEQGGPAPLRRLPPRRAALRPGLHVRFRPHSAVPGGSGPRAGRVSFRSPPSPPSTTRSGPGTAGTAGTSPSPGCTSPTSIPSAGRRWTSSSAVRWTRPPGCGRAWRSSRASSAATPSTSSPRRWTHAWSVR